MSNELTNIFKLPTVIGNNELIQVLVGVIRSKLTYRILRSHLYNWLVPTS